MTNRVLVLRTKLGLSQRALAKRVGVSQQHIQRIETSAIEVGFVLAAKLCAALDQPLAMVFPQTRKIVAKLPTAADPNDRVNPLFYDHKTRGDMKKAGVDMDVIPWFIQLKLRGQVETVDVLLADGETSRLWTILQKSDPDTFVVFVQRHVQKRLAARQADGDALLGLVIGEAFSDVRQLFEGIDLMNS